MKRFGSFVTAAVGAAFVCGGTAVQQADAYDYGSLIMDVWHEAGSDRDRPVGYRDDNFSSVIQIGQSQYVFGYALFTDIQASDGTGPIKNTALAANQPTRQLEDNLGGDSPMITGVFFAEAAGLGTNPETGGISPHQYFQPVDAGTYTIDGVDFDWNPTAGSILQMYATGNQQFNDPGALATAFDDPSVFDLLAELGFSDDDELVVGAGISLYDLGLPYYTAEINAEEQPVNSKGNLALLADYENLFPHLFEHDGGQDVYVNVNRFTDATSDPSVDWDFRGEGGSVRFLVPTPAAVGPGLALLGVIALIRKPRQRAEA